MANQNQTPWWQYASDNPAENCTQAQAQAFVNSLYKGLNYAEVQCIYGPYLVNAAQLGELVTDPMGGNAENIGMARATTPLSAAMSTPYQYPNGETLQAIALQFGGPSAEWFFFFSIGNFQNGKFISQGDYNVALAIAKGTTVGTNLLPGGGVLVGTLPIQVINPPAAPVLPKNPA